ncbi:hypothetical protein [Klebsiella quasipneumoniae]|uniref:hypothetical protein n=1 Tax=Klebsiella quasipneumoniae TaxID=1463165 RepID=UPI003D31ADFA
MTMFLMFSAPCAAVITKPTLRKVTNAKRKRNSMTKLNVISAVSKAQTQAALTTAARITPMTDITELALLVSKAKASVFTLEYISQFEPADIDSDDVDLRFEVDGRDTGTNVSIVDECGQAAKVIGTLVEALEKAQQRIDELENDEVRQRLANAEHQLYMAELAKHNLKASRKAQFRKRRAAEKRIGDLEREQEQLRPVGVMSEQAFHRLENRECRFIALWPRPGIFLQRKRPEDGVIVYARTAATVGSKVEVE